MNESQAVPKDIDEYIAGFPEDIREILEKIRATVREAAPEAKEAIKYKMPTFVLNDNLVHFAVFKNHIGFYPAPREVKEFRDELAAYDGAKSSVSFPFGKPIPFDLIRRIVEFRVQGDLEKAAAKGQRRRRSS